MKENWIKVSKLGLLVVLFKNVGGVLE